jgi:hypothetical protein
MPAKDHLDKRGRRLPGDLPRAVFDHPLITVERLDGAVLLETKGAVVLTDRELRGLVTVLAAGQVATR